MKNDALLASYRFLSARLVRSHLLDIISQMSSEESDPFSGSDDDEGGWVTDSGTEVVDIDFEVCDALL